MNERIAIVVPFLTGGGGVPSVARFIRDTIARSQRFSFRLISLSTSAHDPESMRLLSPGSWLRGAATSTGTWEGTPFTQVGAVLGELEFQRYRPRSALTAALADCSMIQVVSGSPAWANAVLALGKPVALQVATRARVERRLRDAAPQSAADWWRKAMTEVTDRFDEHALKRVDAIQVENPWMLEYARKVNAGREVDLRYAPPGIDASWYRPKESRSLDSQPYVLCVGRFSDPRKNVGLLLEAYAQLPQELRKEVALVLAGGSAPAPEFWQRAKQLGVDAQVRFVSQPSADELLRLHQQASVFALPSDEEGLGIVLLEAMACGVPVVATRCGGPDGIITEGEDGYLVPINDPAAMASRLQRLLTDQTLNCAMGRRARQTVERRYDERVVGDVFIDMWERMSQKVKKS